jgi:hypothetical protein
MSAGSDGSYLRKASNSLLMTELHFSVCGDQGLQLPQHSLPLQKPLILSLGPSLDTWIATQPPAHASALNPLVVDHIKLRAQKPSALNKEPR